MKRILLPFVLLLVCASLVACEQAPKYEEGWTFDQTHHWKKSLTSAEVAQKGEHDFADWAVVKQATHLAEGSRSHKCKTCGYEATEAIGKLACETSEQLVEAVNAASSGDIVDVKGTVTFNEVWTVNKSVTLQGMGDACFTGKPLYVKSDCDVVFRNVTFTSPDNSSQGHANNNASCVYAVKLTGKLTFEGCAFNNAPWDSLQITFEPSSAAEIVVKACTFRNSEKGYRYLHLQTTDGEAPNVKLKLTDSTFYNVSTDFCLDSAITVYGLVKSNMTFENNTFAGEGATEQELTTTVVWVSNGVDQTNLLEPSEVGKVYSSKDD